jgi:hypothetical protein
MTENEKKKAAAVTGTVIQIGHPKTGGYGILLRPEGCTEKDGRDRWYNDPENEDPPEGIKKGDVCRVTQGDSENSIASIEPLKPETQSTGETILDDTIDREFRKWSRVYDLMKGKLGREPRTDGEYAAINGILIQVNRKVA